MLNPAFSDAGDILIGLVALSAGLGCIIWLVVSLLVRKPGSRTSSGHARSLSSDEVQAVVSATVIASCVDVQH